MSNRTGFFAYCRDCGAGLRTNKRLENHRKNRCNVRHWPRKPRPGNKTGE